MLNQMRNGATGFVVKVLMVLLIMSFALWGIGDSIVRSGGSTNLAKVNGDPIEMAEYQKQIEILRRRFGASFTPQLLRELNLYELTLSEMVNRRLTELEASRLGLHIDDDTLADIIRQTKAYYNARGIFDKAVFSEVARQYGMSDNEFIERYRNDLAADLVATSLTISPPVHEAEAEILYHMKHEKRRVLAVSMGIPEEFRVPVPADSVLTGFYDARRSRYKAPEYRALRYVFVTPDELMEKISISKQEIIERYQQQIQDLTSPERRQVQQLLYPSQDEALRAIKLLDEGISFKDVAIKIPPINRESSDLGLRLHSELPAGSDAVFALKEGGYTQPVESAFGWHIFRVKKIVGERVPPLEAVNGKLESDLRHLKAETMLSDTIERFEDALASGMPIEEAAKEADITAHTSEPVDRNGRAADNSDALPVGTYHALLEIAYSLPKGERSEISYLPDGTFYMVVVDGITAPRERTFEEVRGQVLQDWIQSERLEQNRKHVEEKLRQLQAHSHPDEQSVRAALDNESGIMVAEMTLRRDAAAGEAEGPVAERLFAAGLTDEIFTLGKHDWLTGVKAYQDGFIFAVLLDTIPAPATDSADGKALLAAERETLRQEYIEEIEAQYLTYLRQRYPVQINQEAMQSIIAAEE